MSLVVEGASMQHEAIQLLIQKITTKLKSAILQDFLTSV